MLTTLDYLQAMRRAGAARDWICCHAYQCRRDGIAPRSKRLRDVSASQGLMLESAAEQICARGGPHFGSPDKLPRRAARHHSPPPAKRPCRSPLGFSSASAKPAPSVSTRSLALRDLHERYGHIQEIIIQNFRAKPGDENGRRQPSPISPSMLMDHRHGRAAAPSSVRTNIQAPPNLTAGALPQLIAAGINDWGGDLAGHASDHVESRAPWPGASTRSQVRQKLRAKCWSSGWRVYPTPMCALESERWLAPALRTPCCGVVWTVKASHAPMIGMRRAR